MENEFTKRMADLSNRSYKNNMYTFSSFLGESEISELLELPADLLPSDFSLSGGYTDAIRQIARFGRPEELMYEEDFPIEILRITPIQKKFADQLTHRDFLGALMHLGIERDQLGDILVFENEAYLFCHDTMTEMIMRELIRIKHTTVKAELIEKLPKEFEQQFEESEIQVASERIDCVVAKYAHMSRSETAEFFHDRKIFVNGRIMENYSYLLKENDHVSVRGFGKFIYQGQLRATKKGNLVVSIKIYK